jgi:hypothetical protein
MTQPNELLLIGPQHGMVWRELLAKEGDQIYTLVENHADAWLGCVALNGEVLINVQDLEYRYRCPRALERLERRLGIGGPPKPVFA